MEKYIYDENNGLWYERQGGYYIPYLSLPKEEEHIIGLCGVSDICGTSGSTARPFTPACR